MRLLTRRSRRRSREATAYESAAPRRARYGARRSARDTIRRRGRTSRVLHETTRGGRFAPQGDTPSKGATRESQSPANSGRVRARRNLNAWCSATVNESGCTPLPPPSRCIRASRGTKSNWRRSSASRGRSDLGERRWVPPRPPVCWGRARPQWRPWIRWCRPRRRVAAPAERNASVEEDGCICRWAEVVAEVRCLSGAVN